MTETNRNYLNQIAIVVIASLLFIPFLGRVHLFDWDEINFAESAREMLLTGDYLTVKVNFQAFWEKPPMFAWFQVLSMKAFGINEFAARFPNAIAGILTLLVLYNIGKKLYNQRFGLIWVLVYAASILPHFYFKSGIIDPWFNFFIFLGVYFFFLFSKEKSLRLKWVFFSAFSIGLGILTKGPVALLLFLLTAFIYMIISKSYKQFFNYKVLLVYIFTVTLVGGFWFILQFLNGNSDILVKFIEYQIRLFTEEDAGHGGFFLYHFVVLFFGVFPASVFTLKTFRKYREDEADHKAFKRWMLILFWVVLILFTIVNTKIVHYSSMCYFPMSFLAAYIINRIFENKQKLDRWMKISLGIVATIIGSLVAALQFFVAYKEQIIASGTIKDDFAVGNLEADVYWSGFEFLVGTLLIFGVIGSLTLIKNVKNQIIGVFVSSLLFVNLTMIFIVPRIEQYSQNAAISFYKEVSKEDCYLETFGFKSYAIYYYFNKQQPENENSYNSDWLFKGEIDKPVYVVCKNTSEENFIKYYPEFVKLESKNGFVFFKRTPDN
ncbi:MAG: glycosyltransferase family 39 protein [Bacteroidales bacterium]|nr:glycosyltransferase family 39 protein [Bacteroidales bacterium]